MNIFSFSFILSLLFLINLESSQLEMKNLMQSDLEVIKNTFKTQYAPIEWKENYSGWNLESEIEKAKQKVLSIEPIKIKDYQFIVKQFFSSVHDYHATVEFFSTEAAFLPFHIKSAQGRYFITAIDRTQLPLNARGLHAGDEILTFNGKPISQAVNEFKALEFPGNTLTDQAFAEIFFTMRLGSEGHLVPQGQVELGVKQNKSKQPKIYQLNWVYVPEEIKNIIPGRGAKSVMAVSSKQRQKKAANSFTIPINQSDLFKKPMLSPYAAKLELDPIEAKDHLGSRESFVPTLGKKIWESNPKCQFYAYLFETSDHKKVGYIRIPHYKGSDQHVEQFKDLIIKFNQQSDALIIDQVNNPGGMMFYMYALTSMLSDKPLSVPKHRIALTQKEIAFAVDVLPIFEVIQNDDEARQVIGESFDGIPVTKHTAEQFANFFRFEINEWNQGRTFTEPTYPWGIDQILPCKETQYKKPIMILINELDVSCGDFFPAILKDNNRAILFGKKTSGAGGFVLATEYPNLFGIKMFSYTGSIAQRIDNNPIENLGVQPDIEYEVTPEDLTQNYSSYAQAVLKALKTILK